MPNIMPYAGAYEPAYSQPRSAEWGPAYAGSYTGVEYPEPEIERPYHRTPLDRGAHSALVIADNPQPPGAAIVINGFVIDALV